MVRNRLPADLNGTRGNRDHTTVSQLLIKADLLEKCGKQAEAQELYRRVAPLEEKILGTIDPDDGEQLGVIALSAASCYYKAREVGKAREIAQQYYCRKQIPSEYRSQLRKIVREGKP